MTSKVIDEIKECIIFGIIGSVIFGVTLLLLKTYNEELFEKVRSILEWI